MTEGLLKECGFVVQGTFTSRLSAAKHDVRLRPNTSSDSVISIVTFYAMNLLSHLDQPRPPRRLITSPWRTIGCAVSGWTSGTTFQHPSGCSAVIVAVILALPCTHNIADVNPPGSDWKFFETCRKRGRDKLNLLSKFSASIKRCKYTK